MGWTFLGTLMTYGLWYLLSRIKVVSLSTEQEIGSIQERQTLLGINDFEDSSDSNSDNEDIPSDKKESNISAWRLMSYCKPDIPHISLASLFFSWQQLVKYSFHIILDRL